MDILNNIFFSLVTDILFLKTNNIHSCGFFSLSEEACFVRAGPFAKFTAGCRVGIPELVLEPTNTTSYPAGWLAGGTVDPRESLN